MVCVAGEVVWSRHVVVCPELLCGKEGVYLFGRSCSVDVWGGWTCDSLARVVMSLCGRGGCVIGQLKLACAVDMVG